MSLYRFIDTPVPVIDYCVFHQAQPDLPKDEYLKTMKELHLRVAKESDDINAGYTKYIADAMAREGQRLRNTLSHFLQTPFSSDNEEVRVLLEESIGRFRDQMLDGSRAGLQRSREGRLFFVSSQKSAEKRLLKNGKTYLDTLGFKTTKGHPDIYESTFTIEGGTNLDILEHIVRDKLGIYSTTHGKHLKESGGYCFAAYNQAFALGALPAVTETSKQVELDFFFSKPDMKYAPFRSGMSEAVEALFSKLKLTYASLWQRKLGLGAGKEFVLRLMSDESEASADIISFLNGYEKKFVKECLISSGHLLLKEILSTV